MTTFYIVRHGQSESNAKIDKEDLKIRPNGSPLTELGREQAKLVKDRLKDVHFDVAFSSDLERAKETAEIIALERKLAIEARNTIRERSFSSYANNFPDKNEEELHEEMQKDLEKLEETAKLNYKHSSSMESADEAATRMLTFLREIALAYSGKTVLVVNHGNVMRSLLTKLGYASFDELPSGSVKNTGYVVLQSDGTDFFIKETHDIEKQIGKRRTF
jgi:probable phosphoglycerate mutase